MCDVEYIIVVCGYNWKNLGYNNQSLTQLLMVDKDFNPVDSIPFGEWIFKGLGFHTFPGQYYNAWLPYPRLELSSDPRIKNYGLIDEFVEKFPEWEWPNEGIKEFQRLLTSINEFVEANKNFHID